MAALGRQEVGRVRGRGGLGYGPGAREARYREPPLPTGRVPAPGAARGRAAAVGWDVLAALRRAGAGCRVASLPGGKAAELREWGVSPLVPGAGTVYGAGR